MTYLTFVHSNIKSLLKSYEIVNKAVYDKKTSELGAIVQMGGERWVEVHVCNVL